MWTIRIKLCISRSDIVYLNSIIDSYDGVGIVRTVDKEKGEVIIYSSNSTYRWVIGILDALKNEGVKLNILELEKSELVDK